MLLHVFVYLLVCYCCCFVVVVLLFVSVDWLVFFCLSFFRGGSHIHKRLTIKPNASFSFISDLSGLSHRWLANNLGCRKSTLI